MEHNICRLSRDLRFKIMSGLSLKDLNSLCLTSKECKKVCDNYNFWLRKLVNEYPEYAFNKPEKETYRNWYLYVFKDFNPPYVRAITPITSKNVVYLAEIFIKFESIQKYKDFSRSHLIEELNSAVFDAIIKKYDMDLYGNPDYDIISYENIKIPPTIDVLYSTEMNYKIINNKSKPNRILNNYTILEENKLTGYETPEIITKSDIIKKYPTLPDYVIFDDNDRVIEIEIRDEYY